MSFSKPFEPIYMPDQEVGPELDGQLRALFLEAFPREAECLKTRRYFRECPPHRWIIFDSQNQPIAHIAVHEKSLGTIHGKVPVIGIAEVCVATSFRGRGLMRRLFQAVHPWARERAFSFSLLFGKIDFYRSSGYRPATNVFRHWKYQTREWVEELIPIALALPLNDKTWPQGVIDLAGPTF